MVIAILVCCALIVPVVSRRRDAGFWATAPAPERPYRGLFGSGTVDTEQLSDGVSASVGGGYDDNLVADAEWRQHGEAE